MIPTNVSRFSEFGLIFPETVIKARRRLENEAEFELMTSDEYEALLDNPDYIKSDDPTSAMIGFTDKDGKRWKLMPLESMSKRLKIKLYGRED